MAAVSAFVQQAQAATSNTLDFATYRPGEILKSYLEEPTKVVLSPEQDNASECSTADTHDAFTEDVFTGSAMSSDSEPMQSQPGTPDMDLPSIGSVGHSYGMCRPCGFMYHKGGCTAGKDCSFCHFCPAGTIEKQRKMKRQLARSQRQQVQSRVGNSSSISKCPVGFEALAAPANRAASVSLMAAAAAKAAAGLRADFEF
jgi:hypothetical protein